MNNTDIQDLRGETWDFQRAHLGKHAPSNIVFLGGFFIRPLGPHPPRVVGKSTVAGKGPN